MAYEIPAAATLQALYPAFADVADATLDAHIAKAAAEGVDESWLEADYQPAIMALAAHNMALLGIGKQSKAEQYARQGVVSIKSGSFTASFDADKAKAAAEGELSSTPYGQGYEQLLRKNKGGPRVLGSGSTPSASYLPNNGRLPL